MRLLKVLSICIALPLIIAVVAKPWIARRLPGLVAYYSFKPHPFSFTSTYQSGRIGPWTIGESKEKALQGLVRLHRPFRLPMAMSDNKLEELYFSENNIVSA